MNTEGTEWDLCLPHTFTFHVSMFLVTHSQPQAKTIEWEISKIHRSYVLNNFYNNVLSLLYFIVICCSSLTVPNLEIKFYYKCVEKDIMY